MVRHRLCQGIIKVKFTVINSAVVLFAQAADQFSATLLAQINTSSQVLLLEQVMLWKSSRLILELHIIVHLGTQFTADTGGVLVFP